MGEIARPRVWPVRSGDYALDEGASAATGDAKIPHTVMELNLAMRTEEKILG